MLFATVALPLQGQSQKLVADKVVAIVGDRSILQSDVNDFLEEMRYNKKNNKSAVNECAAIEDLLIFKILVLQAEKDSLQITEEQVETQLDQQVNYFTKQLGGEEMFVLYAGKSIQQFKNETREAMKERMLTEFMQEKITGNVNITPSEVKAYFDKIPRDSLPYIESELEIGQVVFYPETSREIERYTIEELNRLKKQAESKLASMDQIAKIYSDNPQVNYKIGRYDKTWDAAFLSAIFRLREGEVSDPIKQQDQSFFIVKMVERKGDIADVQLIMKIVPITDDDINKAKIYMDSIRIKLMDGILNFDKEANTYNDNTARYFSSFIQNNNGESHITISQLDKDMLDIVRDMKVSEYSLPVSFTNPVGRKGIKIVYLKSRSKPHIMNLSDDYEKIADAALAAKKREAFDKWWRANTSGCYVAIDEEVMDKCAQIKKYATAD